ncbi:MAG: SH3 domain-containing protein, partial [Chloroflexota bacterium]
QINGADITFGSTLYINAVRDNQLLVALLEGDAQVSAENDSKRLVPGTQVRMLLGGDDGLTVITPPTDPEPYDLDAVEYTPVELLDREVTLVEPVNAEDIATATATDTPTPTNTVTPDACTVTADSSAVNLRTGPGTVYEVVGILARGNSLVAVGRNTTNTWYVVNDEGELVWIAGSVTERSGDCTDLQIIAAPPTPTPSPTNTLTRTPTPTRTPSPVYATEDVASCVDSDLQPQYGMYTADDFEGSYSTSVVSGGAVSLSCLTRRISCRGYTGEAPDFTFEVDFNGRVGVVESLSIGVTSEEDTVLVIQRPDGTYACDDDTGEGLNPLLLYNA